MKYRGLIRKYSLKKILKMYMKGEITLNNKEWKDLHRRLERRRLFKEKISIVHIGICFVIMLLFAYKFDYTNFKKIEKCNKYQEHICTRYEIERYENEYREIKE